MQSNSNNIDEFVEAYRSFDKSKKSEVFNYYSKCNPYKGLPKVTSFLAIIAIFVFVLGGGVLLTINQNSSDVLVRNETASLSANMSKSDKMNSVRINLESLRSNDFDSTPQIDLASFEF